MQGFALPGTAGSRPSRFHTRCLGDTVCAVLPKVVSEIFNHIPFLHRSVGVIVLTRKVSPNLPQVLLRAKYFVQLRAKYFVQLRAKYFCSINSYRRERRIEKSIVKS